MWDWVVKILYIGFGYCLRWCLWADSVEVRVNLQYSCALRGYRTALEPKHEADVEVASVHLLKNVATVWDLAGTSFIGQVWFSPDVW